MAFAGKTVAIEPAPAVQGDRVNNGAIFYTCHNFLTASTCNVGEFVWRDTTNPEIAVKNSTDSETPVAPLGIVERTHEYTDFVVDSLTVPAKTNVSIIEKGAVWTTANMPVSVGMVAFAMPENGSIYFSDPGETFEGGVETGWKAFTSGTRGDLIMISNVL